MPNPPYPKAYVYVLMKSLGNNEFGASKGFETIVIPELVFDEAANCLKGGNKPVASAVQGDLCSGAYTPAPAAAANSAPVEKITPPAHSHSPHSHSPHSHSPHSHSPHSHHTHNPHSHNPHSHTPHTHSPHTHSPHTHNPHSHSPTPST